MEKLYWVYIMASKRNGTLYVGVTGNLARRIWEHQNKVNKGFTKKYNVNRLVYAEPHGEPGAAIYREKCLKRWKRFWKIKLIEKENPEWEDLSYKICD